MGGLGVFTWLAIGSAAGRVISRLMVGAEDDALRRGARRRRHRPSLAHRVQTLAARTRAG